MAKGVGGSAPKKGKKNRKWGRNVKACGAYRAGEMEGKNRLRRLRRHLRAARHAQDAQARARFVALGGSLDYLNSRQLHGPQRSSNRSVDLQCNSV